MSRIRPAIRSGWKRSKSVSFSPVGREHDRAPGDLGGPRARRHAAGVAVELGQDHGVEVDAVEERLRGGDGVLADHRVQDEEDLVRVHGVADRRRPAP